ncbi:hypothetical protein NX774_12015 [Massilia agilis]|uniref:Uncharacterized protein n=1 Tax=Massilia agilis TaxID=1811226 RepID=A0ABT2DBH4_9BURK|nr:hypothetical protein [Massilia agilis]MCS0808645.1 hypothetical protein [Massilia agilis]
MSDNKYSGGAAEQPGTNLATQGMADCMDMVRQELIEAGIIDKSVPPMMVANAVIAHLARQAKAGAVDQVDEQALNDAAWEFIEKAPENSITGQLWNNLKQALRPAIQKYIALAAPTQASAAQSAPVAQEGEQSDNRGDLLDYCADISGAAPDASAQAKSAGLVKHGDVPTIEITLRQAKALVEFFGGHDGEVSIMERPAVWADQPEGLYAYCTEYPDEGSQYLGPTEVDDDLAMNGEPASAQPALAAGQVAGVILDLIHRTHDLNWFSRGDEDEPFSSDAHERAHLVECILKVAPQFGAQAVQADALHLAAREVLATELGEMASTGSMVPCEHALGLLRDAVEGKAAQAEVRDALKLSGNLCEIGQLEDEDGEHGIVIKREFNFVTIKGLTMDEVRKLAPLAFDDATISISRRTPADDSQNAVGGA